MWRILGMCGVRWWNAGCNCRSASSRVVDSSHITWTWVRLWINEASVSVGRVSGSGSCGLSVDITTDCYSIPDPRPPASDAVPHSRAVIHQWGVTIKSTVVLPRRWMERWELHCLPCWDLLFFLALISQILTWVTSCASQRVVTRNPKHRQPRSFCRSLSQPEADVHSGRETSVVFNVSCNSTDV